MGHKRAKRVYSQINKRIDTAIELIDKVDSDKIMIFLLEIFDEIDKLFDFATEKLAA